VIVSYSVINGRFNEIIGDAFQRMILEGQSPEQTYNEVVMNYAAAIKDVK
jgi:hypothetical protein